MNEEKYYTIYMITHKPTNLKYIGQTTMKPMERLIRHLADYWIYHHPVTTKLREVISRTNQIDDFHLDILEEGFMTKEQANDREQYWISYYDTFHNGLNTSVGGAGRSNITKEERQNMCNDYENSTSIQNLAKKYNHHETTIRRILRQDRGIQTLHTKGLQPPPFYIYNLPWDIVIPNDGSQPLQIF